MNKIKTILITIITFTLLLPGTGFSQESTSETDKTKKQIEQLLKRIKENNKLAQALYDEAKAIADNLKYTAGQKLKILDITIKRESKNPDTEKKKLDQAIAIEKRAKGLYTEAKYREVLKIVDQALRLICTVPIISLEIKPMIFSPDGDGKKDTITITPNIFARDISKVTNWSLIIKKRDEQDETKSIEIKTFKGTGMPSKSITWDGKNDGKLVVDSINNYMVEMKVVDNRGEGTSGNNLFQTDIFLEKTNRGMRVNVSAIQFESDSPELKTEFHYILKRIHSFLLEYPEYKFIVIEGHTSYGPVAKNIKLSNARANSVKKYLLSLGMKKNRIITKGFSHSVPFTLIWDNRPLNRRVTFFLLKSKEDRSNYENHFKKLMKGKYKLPEFIGMPENRIRWHKNKYKTK